MSERNELGEEISRSSDQRFFLAPNRTDIPCLPSPPRKAINPCHPERCARACARESKDPEGADCNYATSGSSTDTLSPEPHFAPPLFGDVLPSEDSSSRSAKSSFAIASPLAVSRDESLSRPDRKSRERILATNGY